jgi:hypothetical protein
MTPVIAGDMIDLKLKKEKERLIHESSANG